jgi:D-amino peptidase
MRIVLSVDMEGIAGIRDARELLACCPEYWDAGRVRLTDDVVAAATGLREGGADEVIVLDNHASGHPNNLIADRLPEGVRVAAWNVFDLPDASVDGMLQVGYHPRRGITGFAPHTYVPGLRLWHDDEEISESHGRAWAARTPLLGITGHAHHGTTLGSLAGVPFLAVQSGTDAHRPQPKFADERESADAIRAFAASAMRRIGDAPRPAPPKGATFAATLERAGDSQVRAMLAGGWRRMNDNAFGVVLQDWAQAREPLATAMNAAMAPFVSALTGLDLSSRDAMARQDLGRRDRLTALFLEALRAGPWPLGTGW